MEQPSLIEHLRIAAGDGPIEPSVVERIAASEGLPPAGVQGAASFYSMFAHSEDPQKSTVRVCDGPTCTLAGAQNLVDRLSANMELSVTRTSCLGHCDVAPVCLHGERVVAAVAGGLPNRVCLKETTPPVYQDVRAGETRLLLSRKTDYRGLERALRSSPADVIEAVKQSGLCGRGGAGFPTGRKWYLVRQSNGGQKYVICNADESEPLCFKDRVLIDFDPHAIIEGILIASYAVGAGKAMIYIRGEYTAQAERLKRAIEESVNSGRIGRGILGSQFDCELTVHRGAGAYICGEETALLESLENRRGEPRVRPPYPASRGLLGQPTAVNNVETLATVAAIFRKGLSRYSTVGHPDQPGTHLHTIQGHVQTPALVEVAWNTTLRQLIELAGGVVSGRGFHFALVGGAAGMFVGEDFLDIEIAESSTANLPAGSGGVLVCDDRVSVPKVLRNLLWFFEKESCGKCTPCRIGTVRARQTMDRLIDGEGRREDLARLRSLARTLSAASLCGLGTSVADPIVTALDRFPQEFDALL